jgi:hypothetical protein
MTLRRARVTQPEIALGDFRFNAQGLCSRAFMTTYLAQTGKAVAGDFTACVTRQTSQ